MIDKSDNDFLSQSIKGMMMTLIAQWNTQMDAARAKTEFASVRPADIRVFAQMRGRTMKLSAIHREMGFSRQAAQQAIDRLVREGMITVEAVPGSNRDKRVLITDKGQRWRTIAAAQIRDIETQIAAVIGDEGQAALRRHLADLIGTMPK